VARQKAEQMAEALVQKAAEIKKEAALPPPPPPPAPAKPAVPDRTVAEGEGVVVTQPIRKAPPRKLANVQDLYDLANDQEQTPVRPRPGLITWLFRFVLGARVRFLLGLILFGAGLLSMRQPGLMFTQQELAQLNLLGRVQLLFTVPLRLPVVPIVVPAEMVPSTGAVLLAGFFLIASALWRSWKMGFIQLPAAAVLVAGQLFLPALGPFSPATASLFLGMALAVLGFLFGRDT
jgi:hypothetical protein